MITYWIVAFIVMCTGYLSLFFTDRLDDEKYLWFYLVFGSAVWPLLFIILMIGAIYINYENKSQKRLDKQKLL